MQRRKRFRLGLAATSVAALAAMALADVPREVSYQGRLTGGGTGTVDLTLKFYDAATAGNELWSEQHKGVVRTDDLFTLNIGSQTTGGIPDAALDYKRLNPSAEGLWLGVSVNNDPELTPRTRLVMVPFAAKAKSAEGLVKPDTFESAVSVDTAGNVGIGRSSPLSRLHVDDEVTIDTDASFELTFAGDDDANIRHTGGHAIYVHAPIAIPTNAGFEITFTGDNNGNITHENGLDIYVHTPLNVPVLRITGGSDLAKPFAVAKLTDDVCATQPGMVVVIDPDNSGQLKLAMEAYDRKVAGIISGAKGLKPGMVMTGLSDEATRRRRDEGRDEEHPVALTGRVWCWCDASYGPIQPGDRLTTSNTPGHAMEVTDNEKAPGAVIGKAMTHLENGKGLVLVLVQPQ